MTVLTYRKRGKHGTSQDSRSPTRGTCVKCFPSRYDVASCLVAVGEKLQMLRVAANIANQAQCTSSSTSVGATARCGLWPVDQYLSFVPIYHQLFSLPTPEDLFPLLLSILSWVFLFVSARPVLE
jgi:hypothetical protein